MSEVGTGALAERLDTYNALLDERLACMLHGHSPVARLYQMMAYHLGWNHENGQQTRSHQGKRLRPALCLLACECAGGTPTDALPGALAIELVHNFSLVHDDIQDRSAMRRGRPTVWWRWGVAHGINVGDGLFSMAQLALHEISAGPGVFDRAAYLLSSTCLTLCEGQFLDLEPPIMSRPALRDDYRAMIKAKTAEMFGCAAQMGALLGAAEDDLVNNFGRFGRVLGEAFQMRDDILGVWGSEPETGKPASDVRLKRMGLPMVIAWENVPPAAGVRLFELFGGAEPLGDDDVAWILDLFEESGVRERAERATRERFEQAWALLGTLAGPPRAVELLHQFVAELSH